MAVSSGAGDGAAQITILAEARHWPALNATGQPKLPRRNLYPACSAQQVRNPGALFFQLGQGFVHRGATEVVDFQAFQARVLAVFGDHRHAVDDALGDAVAAIRGDATGTPALLASCDSARLWSRRSIAVKLAGSRSGADFIAM